MKKHSEMWVSPFCRLLPILEVCWDSLAVVGKYHSNFFAKNKLCFVCGMFSDEIADGQR